MTNTIAFLEWLDIVSSLVKGAVLGFLGRPHGLFLRE